MIFANYKFVTTWCIKAPIEQVWDTIYDSHSWPEWWRGVESVVELEDGGNGDGVGSLFRYTWKSWLPYRLTFDMRVTRVEPPHLLEGTAIGELAGCGRWRLFEGQSTAVVYEWNVRTSRPWMILLSPIGRPIFAWNHNYVMRQGGKSLARHLNAELVLSS